MKVVNLSRRRFVNVRPVTRTTVVLWLVGALLLATNLFLYFQYWIDSVEVRSQREQTLDLIDQQRDAIRDVNRRFDRLDLSAQDQKVEFLNTLIRARTFPWSQLFDDLEEVLIPDARVVLVQPRIEAEKQPPPRRRPIVAQRSRSQRGRSRSDANEKETAAAKPPEEENVAVQLSLRGYVKDDQALADLIDAFYADPSFEQPYLSGENTESSGNLAFNLAVTYLLPKKPPATIELPEETAIAGATAAGTPAAGAPAAGTPAAGAPAAGTPAAGAPAGEDVPPQTVSVGKETPPAAERAGSERLEEEEAMTESLQGGSGDEAAATPSPGRPPAATARNRPPSRRQPEVPTPQVATPSAPSTPTARRLAAGTLIPGTLAAGTPPAGTPQTPGTTAAGTPAAGTPAAGTPAAGTPAAGTPAAGAPQTPGTTATPLHPVGTPSAPADPPRLAAPDSPRSPPPPPVRPTFVEPEATGTPRLNRGGGTR